MKNHPLAFNLIICVLLASLSACKTSKFNDLTNYQYGRDTKLDLAVKKEVNLVFLALAEDTRDTSKEYLAATKNDQSQDTKKYRGFFQTLREQDPRKTAYDLAVSDIEVAQTAIKQNIKEDPKSLLPSSNQIKSQPKGPSRYNTKELTSAIPSGIVAGASLLAGVALGACALKRASSIKNVELLDADVKKFKKGTVILGAAAAVLGALSIGAAVLTTKTVIDHKYPNGENEGRKESKDEQPEIVLRLTEEENSQNPLHVALSRLGSIQDKATKLREKYQRYLERHNSLSLSSFCKAEGSKTPDNTPNNAPTSFEPVIEL